MHVKTMAGLTGARTNMELARVPMRVYKEARRRGDLSAMERAMGYTVEFQEQAEDYSEKAQEGMEEDARLAGEKAELQRQQMAEERRTKRDAERERLESLRAADGAQAKGTGEVRAESANVETEKTKQVPSINDTVEISREGKALLEAERGRTVNTSTGETVQK